MAQFPDFPSKTKDNAIKMLNDRPRHLSLAQIARDTGLSEVWLGMFARNQITHASIGRVEKLHGYLVEYYKNKYAAS